MVIKSGKPFVTVVGSVALGLAIAETTPNQIAVTNVVSNILKEFNDGALIVISPGQGVVSASSVAGQIIAMREVIAPATGVLHLQPDANQSGRSLTFAPSAGNNLAGLDLSDLTTAVKPKFTVETLVSRLLAKIAEREASVPADANKFAIVVDQINKRVGIVKFATVEAAEDAVTSGSFAAGESISITLTPDAQEVSSNPLPFEGGTV